LKPVIRDHGFCTWVNKRYKNHLFVYEKILFQNQTINQTINQIFHEPINQTFNQTINQRFNLTINQTNNQTLSAANITKAKPSLKSDDEKKIVSSTKNNPNITWNYSSNNDRYKYIKHGYDAVIIILSFLVLAFLIVFIPLLPFLLCTYKSKVPQNQVCPLYDSARSSGQVSLFSVSPARSLDLVISPGAPSSLGSSCTPLVTRKAQSLSKGLALEDRNLPNQPN